MNVLITGGAGFIGSNLALKLLSRGYTVTVMDSLEKQIHGETPERDSSLYLSIKDKVRFIRGNVTCRKDWEKALEGQECVVHLAAETGTGQSMYQIEHYTQTNVGGTALFLDILANQKHSVKKMIVAASRAIYGEGKYRCAKDGIVYPLARLEKDMLAGDFECHCPLCGGKVELLATSEDSLIHPVSIYGICKQMQEEMFLLMGESLSIETASFRYQNVYGPGQSLKNPYTGILSIFSTQIKNHNNLNIFEDGLESRDFVYIDDVTEATALAIANPLPRPMSFNVGCDSPVTVMEVAQTLKSIYDADIAIRVSGNFRIGDIRHNYADLSRIRKILGYEPKWSFKRGIAAFCSWVDGQEVQPDNYRKSVEEMKMKGLFK